MYANHIRSTIEDIIKDILLLRNFLYHINTRIEFYIDLVLNEYHRLAFLIIIIFNVTLFGIDLNFRKMIEQEYTIIQFVWYMIHSKYTFLFTKPF